MIKCKHCGSYDCAEIAKEYVKPMRQLAEHFSNNPLSCSKMKSATLQYIGRSTLISGLVFIDNKINEKLSLELDDHVVLLVPKKIASTIARTIEELKADF